MTIHPPKGNWNEHIPQTPLAINCRDVNHQSSWATWSRVGSYLFCTYPWIRDISNPNAWLWTKTWFRGVQIFLAHVKVMVSSQTGGVGLGQGPPQRSATRSRNKTTASSIQQSIKTSAWEPPTTDKSLSSSYKYWQFCPWLLLRRLWLKPLTDSWRDLSRQE